MMRRIFILPLFFSLGLFSACAGRSPRPTIESPLALDQVVLYRNGIGYFERSGKVDGDRLRLRVRKDQVDDLLKSLTVVDTDGKAVSISMPLDPASWASAAMHTLAPGRGSLAEMLDSLRGREVSLVTRTGRLRGRIAMVERIEGEPDPDEEQRRYRGSRERSREVDHKVSLLVGRRMEVLRLSKVRSVVLHDGDLAMQLHRTLDASAGEGMFEEVEIELRLTGARSHDLRVSYVVEAPMWKPTYRVVLPEGREGKALLQGWAVVDNVSGEDWSDISLSLTSGGADRLQLRSAHAARSTEARLDREWRAQAGRGGDGGSELAGGGDGGRARRGHGGGDGGGERAFPEQSRQEVSSSFENQKRSQRCPKGLRGEGSRERPAAAEISPASSSSHRRRVETTLGSATVRAWIKSPYSAACRSRREPSGSRA